MSIISKESIPQRTNSNWGSKDADIMKRVLDFGDAAEVISTGKEREYWIPSIDDMREKDSRDLLTGAAVNQGAAEILAKPGDASDKGRVNDKYLPSLRPCMIRSIGTITSAIMVALLGKTQRLS